MPEDTADVGDLPVSCILAWPQADFLALHIGIVQDTVRPAIGLDRLEPGVGILVVRVSDRFRVPGLADTFSAAAQDTDIAGHGLQCRCHTVVLFAIGVTTRRPGRLERSRLGGRVHAGKLPDVSGFYTTNFRSPFRGLGLAVGVAEDIIPERLLASGPVGHGAGVHPLHETIDEVLVLKIAGEYIVRHARQHGRIRIGPDGNPPCVINRSRVRILRVDQYEFAAALFGHTHVIEGIAAVEGVGRVPAPHNDQL